MANHTIDKFGYGGENYILQDNVTEFKTINGNSLKGTGDIDLPTTDEKLKVGTVTSGNTYYPVLSTSGTTASTKQIDTAGLRYYSNNGVVQLQVGSSTKIGDIDLISGSYSVSLWPGNLTDIRTLTLPDASGTLALTSDITTAVLTATDDGAGNVTFSVTCVTSINLNAASGVSF